MPSDIFTAHFYLSLGTNLLDRYLRVLKLCSDNRKTFYCTHRESFQYKDNHYVLGKFTDNLKVFVR